MQSTIDGNTALVTGSSSGLGKASATALVKRGVNVAINGRNSDRIEETVTELEDDGAGNVVGIAGDLTRPNDIEKMVNQTVTEFGGLDHLVTSIGGPPSGPFLETTDEDWYNAYDLLVMSVVRLVRESADHLEADGGGTIVNITSRSVKEAIDSLVLSNSVRMSVVGLEKTLSKELAPKIRANTVLPGPNGTSRTEELIRQGVERGDYEDYESGLDARSEGIPLGRIGDPMELGEVVAFLCSERSSYVNGVAIPVDGGASSSNL